VLVGTHGARPRSARRRTATAFGAFCLSLAFVVPTVLLGLASPAAAYPTSTVLISGHGDGHGIGMGQWGSLGYAIGQDNGLGPQTYQWILAHYYGNDGNGGAGASSLQTVPDTTLNGGNVLVAMTEANGADTIVSSPQGNVSVGGTSVSSPAVLLRLSGSTYQVWTSGGCAGQGGWVEAASGVADPTALAAGASIGTSIVNLCTTSSTLELHGELTAEPNSDGAARTVNTVPLEQYVADVAAAESPSTWAALGGAGPQGANWGFQQTEAQVVAARSYVEASPLSYGGYADTCDQTCQSYPGMRWENLYDDGAAADTANEVMVVNGTSTVATTEYSASSGGYSTGAQFPAVPDAGDSVCVAGACNPNHDWTVSVPVSSMEAAYPQVGTLSSIVVTQRNGLGDDGGRVQQVVLSGSGGSVTVTGNSFAAAANLMSNWFTIGGQASGGVGGYWINASDGGVFSFGNAQFYGSTGGMHLNQPVVAMASTHDAAGYWEVASDGGVFSFGDAHFYGSTGSIRLNKPMVGMAATPDGAGYWLVASDGGIFAYGDAQFYGSTGSLKLNKPIIGMVPTHDGGGYWLIASDGGVFAFGDAGFFGSLGGAPPTTALVGVAPTPDGGGYWVLGANGTVYGFGDAPQVGIATGSPALSTMKSPMTGLIPDVSGQGFDAVNASGQAFAFGDAPYFGDVTTAVPGYGGHAVGIAVSPG
jgi:SpoIID/LytB domain protein